MSIERFSRGILAAWAGLVMAPAVGAATASLYVSDYVNGKVLKFDPDGFSSTFASVPHAWGLAVDTSGNVFVSTNLDGQVLKITPDGVASTFAQLSKPTGMAVDAGGNLFVCDQAAQQIVQFTPNANKSSFASGVSCAGLAFDGAGNLFASDILNYRILEFDPNGRLRTFSVGFNVPAGVAFDASGNLFVADENNNQIVELDSSGGEHTFATGLSSPVGLAFDADGSLFVGNNGTSQILKIKKDGTKITFASPQGAVYLAFAPSPSSCAYSVSSSGFTVSATSGTASVNVTTNLPTCSWTATSPVPWLTIAGGAAGVGNGTVTFSYLTNTSGATQSTTLTIAGKQLAFAQYASLSASALYASDYVNGAILKFAPDGLQSTFAFVPHAFGLAVDASGNVFVSTNLDGQVLKLTPDGFQSPFATLSKPVAMAVDAGGNLFVCDQAAQQIVQFTPNANKSSFASGVSCAGLAFDGAGNLFASDILNNQIVQYKPNGGARPFAIGFNVPAGVAFDASGNLFVADENNNQIVELDSSGGAKTFAPGLRSPIGLAFDAEGSLLVANNGTGQILKIKKDGTLTTFAGGPATAYLAFAPSHAGVVPASVNAPSPSAVTSSSATLSDTVNPNGSDTKVWFQYSTSEPFGCSLPMSTPAQDIGAGTAFVTFSAQITGLSSNTRYYFEACASNAGGLAANTTGTFTTPAAASNIKITSVGNGASFDQSFAPGMLMSVFGTSLSSGSPQTVTNAPLPLTASSGTSVAINGIAAPLLYISATQINLQIPYEVPAGQATLVVNAGGQTGSINFAVQPAAPGIFLDETGHIVPNESAAVGSTIGMFVTGAGVVTPPEQTGNVPAAGTTPIPNLPVTVTVGGVPANLSYVGIPGWSVGTLQINFTLPSSLAVGIQPVVVTIGGVPSPMGQLTVTH